MRVHLVKLGETVPGEAGRPRRMTLLARALVAAGHQVTWWSSDWNHQRKTRRPPDLAATARAEGIDLRLLPALGYRRNVSLARSVHHELFARRLVSALDSEARPDLIWACYPTIPVALKLSAWSRPRGVRIIYDIRDLAPDVFFSLLPPWAAGPARLGLFPLYRKIGAAFAGAAGLVAVSSEYLSWAERLAARAGQLPPHRQVFPLGYQLLEAVTAPAPASAPLTAIFAGTFGKSFDLDAVIGAAELLHLRRQPIRLLIAGDGEGADRLAAAAARLDSLDYLGWLPAEALAAQLAAAGIGLMAYAPRATQSLPNKIFEYMAHGLRIVSSLPGEASRLIQANGLGQFYRAGDAESLYGALLAVAAEPDRVHNAKRARALFAESYDAERISRAMGRFIEGVVKP